MSGVWQDVRFAVANLRRTPGFTAAAMVTLTIGIGAVTSVFTLVNALLLEPLPYPSPGEIVFLRGELRRDTPREFPLSYLDLEDLASQNEAFSAVSPVSSLRSFNLAFGSEVEHVNGEMVADAFFTVFAMPPALGRTFSAGEWQAPSAAPVAVLAHDFWQRRFGGDPAVLGRTITLNDRGFEIIGVAARNFRGVSGDADLWLPIGQAGPIYGPHYTDMRLFRWISGVARLKPGVTIDQARAHLESWSRVMAEQFPKENAHLFMSAVPLQDALVGDTRAPLLALLGASAFVLMIGSVNIANLLLARGIAREREVAVRRALGAGGTRVLRQFVTESFVLVLPACVLGIVLAHNLTAYLAAVWAADLESFVNVAVDVRVLAGTIVVSALSAIAFGTAPAVSASRVAPQRALIDGSRGATVSRARRRVQSALVVGEVALAVTLLAGAGLMTKGFSSFMGSDLGFRPDNLLTLRLDLTADQYKQNERFWSVARSVLDAVSATPGVTAAALEGPGLPTGGYYGGNFLKYGDPPDAPQVSTLRHHVSPGYFRALGIPLLAGRDFDDSDNAAAPRAIVVSEALARRTWPGENPLGQRLLTIGGEPQTLTVIGVAGNVRHDGRVAETPREPDIYVSIFQSPARSPSLVTVITRTQGEPASAAPGIAGAVRRAAPGLPPYDVRTMQELLDQQTVRSRFAVRLMVAFAGVALVLAVVGVYGVIAYTVSMRTREIGIRAALGASRGGTVWLVLRQGLLPVGAGVATGLVAIAALERYAESLLYGVGAADPWVLAATSAALVMVGAAACALPAWRASRIHPGVALRND